MAERIETERLIFTPTMQCNLKCKLCGLLVPHYEYRPTMTEEDYKSTISTVFQLVDHTWRLQITGGEPFLFPQLPEFISYCFEFQDQFDELWLLTNGTVPPTKELLSVLKEHSDKITLHVSDYGLRQEVTSALVEAVQELGCKCRYFKYYGEQQYWDGWVDQGDYVCHNRSEEELKEMFRTCPQASSGGFWHIRHGQMHWCGRSIRGTEVGKIPSTEEDYLDIYRGTIEERRERLRNLMKREFVTSCNYCNGYYGTKESEKRYPAGEQM